MNGEYLVWFGEKPYYIIRQLTPALHHLTCCGGTIIVNHPTPGAITQTIHDLERTDAKAAIILTNQVDHYWQFFYEHFKVVEAAGGLVRNHAGEWLFIYRRDYWDLPKGKRDDGESLAACALREVSEETGLHNLRLGDRLEDSWHVYHEKGKPVLKHTQWYLMEADGNQQLVPQTEEDIEEIRWMNAKQVAEILPCTYASIAHLVRSAGITTG